jgi:hypothetical protein
LALASSAFEKNQDMGTFQIFLIPSISCCIMGPRATCLPAQLKTITASASGILIDFAFMFYQLKRLQKRAGLYKN